MTARPARSFVPTGRGTGPTAGGPTGADPAPPVSDFPIKEPSNIGHPESGSDFSLAALMDPAPDPELDKITQTYGLPRYLVAALRLYHVRTRRTRQDIVADALRAHLPAVLVDECRRNADRR